ncbi:MAG: right-handed parallel beta-helix repeat-containing protein, partial [Bacteroidetes bacterium]|nr:right-handed parallel beta-helix repeat-containing protein [Bacteroidota bacterium]
MNRFYKPFLIVSWLFLFGAFTSTSFAQDTFYVATTGNDNNDGSQGSPWLTIQFAVDNVTSGSTIRVGAGSYDLTGSITPNIGVNIPVSLTLVADDYVSSRDSTTTTLLANGNDDIDLRISASNVTVQGFTIDLSTSGNGGILITGDPLQNFHLLNNRIYLPTDDYAFQTGGNNDYSGLHINDNNFIGDEPVSNVNYIQGFGIYLNPTHTFGEVTDIQVNGNTFSGKVLQGINNAGMSNCTIDGNTLSTEITTVSTDQPYLIRLTNDNAAQIQNIFITNNNLGAAGVNKGGKNGIILRNPVGNVDAVTISGNVIKNGIVTGIHQEGDFTDVTYLNNTISDNPIGIEIIAGSVTSISNNEISNNTDIGIKISGSPTIGPINENSFFSNATYGVNNTSGTIVDATINWWGDLSGPAHSSNTFVDPTGAVSRVAASDNVTFVRWLDDGTDGDGGAAGFVPDGSQFAPVKNTNDNTFFSSIQAAIDAGTTADGETITAVAGTYTEAVTVNKALTITGTGAPTVTGGFILADSPITITGFNTASTDVVNVQQGGSIQDAIALVNSGGTINVPAGTYDAITISDSITIKGEGIVIIINASPAITVNATNVTITGLTFNFDAADYAIDVSAGAYNVTIVDNNFINTNGINVGNGVINRGTGTVTATHNYWGHASGPTVASNPDGTGNIISNASTGTLNYSPWYSVTGNPPTVLRGVPFLASPANAATGQALNVTLSWSSVTGADRYTLEVNTASDFTGTAINVGGQPQSGTSKAPGGLSDS